MRSIQAGAADNPGLDHPGSSVPRTGTSGAGPRNKMAAPRTG